MPVVHVRVSDATSGCARPVRLRISAADGTEYPPLGHTLAFPVQRHEDVGGRVRLGTERWFYVDAGGCEVRLPGGVTLRVQASAGPEYHPLDTTVTLGTGQLTLRLSLERRWDRPAELLAADLRCHDLSPHAALLEAAAEGLDLVQLLARPYPLWSQDGNVYTVTPQLLAFSGQQPALERDGRVVAVNTLNSHPVLGTVALLHAHRPIFPLTFGGEEDSDDWSVGDWCDQCHRKGGLSVWVAAFEPAAEVIGGDALLAALLGQLDAIEVSTGTRRVPLLPWVYHLWNVGVLLPLVGASGKESNRQVLGQPRTWIWAAERGQWVEAVRRGECCVSDGPLLRLERHGTMLRAELEPPEATAELELVADGAIVARGQGSVAATVEGAGWAAARLGGERIGHTSPLRLAEQSPQASASAARLRQLVERAREWILTAGRFEQPRRRQALLERCDAAIARLEAAVRP